MCPPLLAAIPLLAAGAGGAGAAAAGAGAVATSVGAAAAGAGAAAAGTAAAGLTASQLLLASTAVSTVGAITAGVGQYQQAQAASEAAAVQAKDAMARGDQAASDLAKEQASFRGQQRAALAANGVELDYGAAAQIQSDTLLTQREDQRRVRDNRNRAGWGYSVEGAMQRAAGRGALIGGALNAGSTLLSGASKTYASYKANSAPVR